MADFDVQSNLIRVHSPSNLTQQESTKSARASAVKKKVELEDSVEPILSEIFRLYYISPAQAKTTINELFTSTGEAGFSPIQITEEVTTRSIIVRGKSEDLDVVDKIIGEIRSAVFSPTFNMVIGIAMINKPYFLSKDKFDIIIDSKKYTGEICDIPFV